MKLELFDTHCHIQSIDQSDNADFTAQKWQKAGVTDPDLVIKNARDSGVTRLLCVGTDLKDSQRALEFVAERENCWASVGIHPHEAKGCFDKNLSASSSKSPFRRDFEEDIKAALAPLKSLGSKNPKDSKVVAIGEVGLDYYYEHSPKKDQIRLLEYFLDTAQSLDLPLIFHVRDAHEDFWPIFDNFKNLRGVMHSFSAGSRELEQALKRDLHIGLNGIMTFTREESQLEAARNVPLDKLLLETDAPYLTPQPFRGKICQPEHTAATAKFLAKLRGENLEELAFQTTKNACKLFGISL